MIELDRSRRVLRAGGRTVRLTRDQGIVMGMLVEMSPRPASRGHLLVALGYRPGVTGQARNVDRCVARLRAKLGAAGDQIETVRGAGYCFHQEAEWQ